jgi:hypothetical protein
MRWFLVAGIADSSQLPFTSAAVIAEPSANFASGFSFSVQTVKSAFGAHSDRT